MKYTNILIVWLVVVISSLGCYSAQTDAPLVHIRTVRMMDGNPGEAHAGTGFLATSGTIVTAAHIFFEGHNRIEVWYRDDDETKMALATIAVLDVKNDMAVLDVDLAGKDVQFCQPKKHERIRAFGWRFGPGGVATDEAEFESGRVREEVESYFWRSSVNGYHGFSGGPVISTERECVLGVTQLGDGTDSWFSEIQRSSAVKEHLLALLEIEVIL